MNVIRPVEATCKFVIRRIVRRPLREKFWRRSLHAHPDQPIISFTFDDFPRSAWTVGGRILRDNGILGTYYASLGLIGSTSRLGELLTLPDVQELLETGHELACHTYSHADCRGAPFSVYLDDVNRNQRELENLFPNRHFQNHAFPSGRVSLTAKRKLGRYFRSLRGVYGGINAGSIDLNLLRTNRLYSDSVSFAEVEGQIKANQRQKGWLIFCAHDIRERPSPVGCTPRYFEKVVQMALQSGAAVVTIEEALNRLLKPCPENQALA